MGLVKRVDYNGRVKELKPEWVIPSNDGGPDIVTRKIGLRGSSDDTFNPVEMPESGLPFTEKNYINPGDPNHLHYYAWRWFSEIAGGSDEVIRHAIKGGKGNDILVSGTGITGNEQYKISSYNRSKKTFTVLIYSSGANGKGFRIFQFHLQFRMVKSSIIMIPRSIFGVKVFGTEQNIRQELKRKI